MQYPVDPTISLVLVFIAFATIGVYLFWTRHSNNASFADRIATAQKHDNLDIDAIVAECQQTKKPWKDPSFGHDAFPGPSIGYTLELKDGERGKPLPITQNCVTWQPPSQFCTTSRPLFVRGDGVPTWLYSDTNKDGVVSAAESMQLSDIQQGSVGNCYFLSALAAVVQHHPDFADDLIDETYEEYGIYGVSFWRRGQWCMTWVDAYFPCYKSSSRRGGGKHKLLFCTPTDRKEIWPLVVEKAFAKLAGSYEAISGGRPYQALQLLTGGQGSWRRANPEPTVDEWNTLKEQVQSDEYLVAAGSQQEEGDPLQAAQQKKTLRGIVTGHAYTIVNAYDDDHLRLVELRNPWGHGGEWKGDWGPGSRQWDTEEGRKVGSQVGSSSSKGRFWMSFSDFCNCFTTIETCHMNFTPEDRARREDLRQEAERIVTDKPHEKNSSSAASGGGDQPYTQESADAMMELLIAEEAMEKRKQQIGARGNKRKTGKKRN